MIWPLLPSLPLVRIVWHLSSHLLSSDLTSTSSADTYSNHVTLLPSLVIWYLPSSLPLVQVSWSPLNGSDLTSPSIADTCSNHTNASDLTSPSITAICSSHVTRSPLIASDFSDPMLTLVQIMCNCCTICIKRFCTTLFVNWKCSH